MAASSTFKISDEVRDVLARSTITATSVQLPPGQLDRKLYEAVNKALAGAGGKWNRSKGAHLFDRDPRAALGMAVETGKAVNLRTASQAFYTPPMLADRVVAHANLRPGMRVLEPSIGEGALVLAAVRAVGPELIINGYDTDEVACERARARKRSASLVLDMRRSTGSRRGPSGRARPRSPRPAAGRWRCGSCSRWCAAA